MIKEDYYFSDDEIFDKLELEKEEESENEDENLSENEENNNNVEEAFVQNNEKHDKIGGILYTLLHFIKYFCMPDSYFVFALFLT